MLPFTLAKPMSVLGVAPIGLSSPDKKRDVSIDTKQHALVSEEPSSIVYEIQLFTDDERRVRNLHYQGVPITVLFVNAILLSQSENERRNPLL
ncbi:hypothetical protein V1477_004963 [Vespula maculifrons]|uniref:Uncharacterized protein n=1 Tax=Vespula maculifrons TaxID=7453 RepID=A0ABD2CNA3_VESMC